MPLHGECLCGNVQVTIKDEGLPLKPVVCRCTNCQQTSGSLFSIAAILPKEHVEITGETRTYQGSTSQSGNTMQRRLCGACGSPIDASSPSSADQAIIKMGLFAKAAWGKEINTPVLQIFTKNRKHFEVLIEGVHAVETTP